MIDPSSGTASTFFFRGILGLFFETFFLLFRKKVLNLGRTASSPSSSSEYSDGEADSTSACSGSSAILGWLLLQISPISAIFTLTLDSSSSCSDLSSPSSRVPPVSPSITTFNLSCNFTSLDITRSAQSSFEKVSEMMRPNKMELVKRLEEGLVGDEELKVLMRNEIQRRLQWGYKPTHDQQLSHLLNFAKSLRQMNIATETDALNSQMYEVPISFLKIMLGKTIKASCCYFKDDSMTLDEAEIAMLDLYCERAQLRDGQRVLDLGCRQGALTLHVAQKYENCHVTAITNSQSQKDFIEEQSKIRKLPNVEVLLTDITTLEMDLMYDRILVIGLFEHMKNYELLLRMISRWMTHDGLLFVEHVCHKTFAYHYEPLDEDDWYTEYIFPSGTMIIPSASFLLYFQDDVSVVDHWTLSGKHFSRSHEEWLKRVDANVEAVRAIMESFSGSKETAGKCVNYWRSICISSMDLFGYKNGEEWMVSQVLFKKK